MAAKCLTSWKIKSSESFYPLGIRCIGDDKKDRGIIIYAAHTLNAFIFRNFDEDVKDDKAPHKSYLHKSFFPERITDITVGTNESAILLENGHIKYFSSPKKLMTVEYLSCIKSICSTRNGFAFIKTTLDGSEFFIEFHPDAFQNEPEIKNRPKFNITFEKIAELQSCWNQSHFKLKDLAITNKFLKIILPDQEVDSQNGSFLFLSIDNSFCSIQIINGESSVNPIVMCTSRIINFWASESREKIMLLLENGYIDIIYLNSDKTCIDRKSFCMGTNLLSFDFLNDIFIFSNGLVIEYGSLVLKSDRTEFEFKRTTIHLSGIVALLYLPDIQSILCASENCKLYSIPVKGESANCDDWNEINDEILNCKYQVIELKEAYENVLNKQMQQQSIQNILELKQNDSFVKFSASCSVAQTPPRITSPHYLLNSLAYDSTSFFVSINIDHTVMYANELDKNSWSLCCRWLNDLDEYVCVYIQCEKLPFMLIIHLQQKHLPNFYVEVSKNVRGGNLAALLNFPVQVEQPDYCKMMNISMMEESIEMDNEIPICSIFTPKSISLGAILEKNINMKSKENTEPCIYKVFLLDKEMIAIHDPQNETLCLKTQDVDLLYAFKNHFHRKVENHLLCQDNDRDVNVPYIALKEYSVSK